MLTRKLAVIDRTGTVHFCHDTYDTIRIHAKLFHKTILYQALCSNICRLSNLAVKCRGRQIVHHQTCFMETIFSCVPQSNHCCSPVGADASSFPKAALFSQSGSGNTRPGAKKLTIPSKIQQY